MPGLFGVQVVGNMSPKIHGRVNQGSMIKGVSSTEKIWNQYKVQNLQWEQKQGETWLQWSPGITVSWLEKSGPKKPVFCALLNSNQSLFSSQTVTN